MYILTKRLIFRILIGFSPLLLSGCNFTHAQHPDQELLSSVTESDLKRHLTYIASDELGGREAGTPGLKLAADYLAKQLKSYGFEGAGPNGSFFQEVPLHQTIYDQNSLTLNHAGKGIEINPGVNISILPRHSVDRDLNVKGPVIFIGTGLNGMELKKFKQEEIEGRIVVRYDLDDETRKQGDKSYRTTHRGIRDDLFKLGAEAVIMVVPDYARASFLIGAYSGYGAHPQTSLIPGSPQPYLIVTFDVFNQMLKTEGKSRPSKEATLAFSSPLQISMKAAYRKYTSNNVIAILKGSDTRLADEYVAYSSHYDHIGTIDGLIYNGADDDGSGTVAVLEIAEAISKRPPRRSTLITFHTAEEKGLLGSKYFVQNPLVPLDKIVALLNIDMIGRSKDKDDNSWGNRKTSLADEIYLIGADKLSDELNEISEETNRRITRLKLNYSFNDPNHPDNYYQRSDHYNYAKKGVPIIFYFDGGHVDYHKPTDTIEKIDFKKMRTVTQLVLSTGYFIQNKTERLALGTNSTK